MGIHPCLLSFIHRTNLCQFVKFKGPQNLRIWKARKNFKRPEFYKSQIFVLLKYKFRALSMLIGTQHNATQQTRVYNNCGIERGNRMSHSTDRKHSLLVTTRTGCPSVHVTFFRVVQEAGQVCSRWQLEYFTNLDYREFNPITLDFDPTTPAARHSMIDHLSTYKSVS